MYLALLDPQVMISPAKIAQQGCWQWSFSNAATNWTPKPRDDPESPEIGLCLIARVAMATTDRRQTVHTQPPPSTYLDFHRKIMKHCDRKNLTMVCINTLHCSDQDTPHNHFTVTEISSDLQKFSRYTNLVFMRSLEFISSVVWSPAGWITKQVGFHELLILKLVKKNLLVNNFMPKNQNFMPDVSLGLQHAVAIDLG